MSWGREDGVRYVRELLLVKLVDEILVALLSHTHQSLKESNCSSCSLHLPLSHSEEVFHATMK